VPMNLTPREIHKLLAAGAAADIDAAVVRIYSTNGGAEFEALSRELVRQEELLRWRGVLRQAASAYRRRDYLVVVPALLLVLEGFVATRWQGHGTRVRQIVEGEVGELRRGMPGSVTLSIWSGLQAFVERLFESRSFEGRRPTRINRHWILHGRGPSDWKQADALRLFVALHTMSRLRTISRTPRPNQRLQPTARR
jgi:hypothetical protein